MTTSAGRTAPDGMRLTGALVFLSLGVASCVGIADVPATSPAVPSSSTVAAAVTSTSAAVPEAPTTTVVDREPWFLGWNSGVLVDGFVEALEAVGGVDGISLIQVGLAQMVRSFDAEGSVVDAPEPGFVIPLETHVFDLRTYSDFLPDDAAAALANLGPEDVALGATSARIRRIGVGGALLFDDGSQRRVAAVIADEWLGGAELAVSSSAVPPGPVAPRYVVFRYDGSTEELSGAVDLGVPLRFRAESDVRLLRHADVVRTQAEVKEQFGEYSFRPGRGTEFTIDPAWVEANIIEVELPLLGLTKCHKDFAPILAEAMQTIIQAGQSAIIDPAAFAGCWNARYIADKRGISRHSWGAAADINIFNDLNGPTSPADPLLIDTFHNLGVTSGVNWLTPDPGHFEWYGPNPP